MGWTSYCKQLITKDQQDVIKVSIFRVEKSEPDHENFLVACLFTVLCMLPVFFLKTKKKTLPAAHLKTPVSNH